MDTRQREALVRLQKYCAYQERCHTEVEEKLRQLGIYGDKAGELLIELNRTGFLDEERYARAFVRGKFRLKKWGRVKITVELKKKRISEYCIRKGFEELDTEEYMQTLRALAENRWERLEGESVWEKRKKIGSHLLQKGYEPEYVNELLKELAEV